MSPHSVQLSAQRSGRSLATGPLLATLVAVLITADFFLILERHMPVTLAHTLIVGFLIVCAIELRLEHNRKAAVAEVLAGMAAAAADINARRCCCSEVTEPLRVVATATVRTAAVVPAIDRPTPRVDTDVIDMAERIHEKMIRAREE